MTTKRLVISLLVTAMIAAVPLAFAEDSGQQLFDQKCAMCHGKDGVAKSMAKGSGNFNDPAWQEAHSVDTIIDVTTNGKEKMKPYKDKLSADQIKMIAEYIKTLAK